MDGGQTCCDGLGNESPCPTCCCSSHSPKEFTSVADMEKGIDILSEILYKLAY